MTETPTEAPAAGQDEVLVACLCAAWCRVCEGYAQVFEGLCAERPGCRFVWIDIEDEDALLGELEIETFPTLLVAKGSRARFLGPVPPQPAPALRLIDALTAPDARPAEPDPAAQALLTRLLARS